MCIIGIDPGLDGGIAELDERGEIVSLVKPAVVKAKKGRNTYEVSALVRVIKGFQDPDLPIHAFVEKQQPLPAMTKEGRKLGGSIANFHRGYGFGIWQGILTALGIPFEPVAPMTWQGAMLADVPKGDTKAASVLVATRIWPKVDFRRSEKGRKPDHGLCDAALLALYGLRYRIGKGAPADVASTEAPKSEA